MPTQSWNEAHYDLFWGGSRIGDPVMMPEWPIIRDLLPTRGRVLEIGPGLRPRVPIADSFFVDLSIVAGRAVKLLGGNAVLADACHLPFCSSSFDLLVAAHLLEHIPDDQCALREWSRIMKPAGRLFLAVPLHRHLWTTFDRAVGHVRRYEPGNLQRILEQAGFQVERYAVNRLPLYRVLNQLGALVFALSPRIVMWLEGHLAESLGRRYRKRGAHRPDWHVQLDQENDRKAATAFVICTRR